MIAEIITIGDELLIGQVVDTNSAWLGKTLNKAGIMVRKIISISDNKEEILNTLDERIGSVDLILISGGLGPTKDDITKHTLCEYFDTKLILNQEALEDIKSFFEERKLPLTELNRQQAMLPEACKSIRNLNGTARGMWFEKNDTIIISMPGVPFEMKPMVSDFIIPELNARFCLPYILHRTIHTSGIGESFLSDLVESWENTLNNNIKVAYLPQPGMVRVRLSCTGEIESEVRLLIEEAEKGFLEVAGKYVFGFDDQDIQGIFVDYLKTNNYTLSTAESCTGGYLSHLITSVPGSSAVFKGGIIAYSNEVKKSLLGVNAETLDTHGAVSEQTVVEMAEGVRTGLKTDFGIAISGIAGPDGGNIDKPVGMVCIAIAGTKETHVRTHYFGHLRENNIRRAAIMAMNSLLLLKNSD